MPSHDKGPNRLWVQVMPSCKVPRSGEEAVVIPAAIVADMIASGVGAIVKSAADQLIASDKYVIKTVLAYEPAFVIRASATSASFLLNCITLNVGPNPISLYDQRTRVPLLFDRIEKSSEYEESPVVIRLEFHESTDGVALAARVMHWRYTQFLDPSPTPFRTPKRKVTVEVKISDVEGTVLLATAMQVEADRSMLPNSRPNGGERLPWIKRPVKNFSGERVPGQDKEFGPVNIEATITEVAEPSVFAKILGATLGNQKAAIERYVKDRVTQALDETEAAKARLVLLKEASTSRDEYEAAYKAAAEAKKSFEDAVNETARIAAKETLTLKLATLLQKEAFTRTAFDRAGLPFEPMPALKAPALTDPGT